MPKILELKTIQGELWARIGAIDGEGAVLLLTESEVSEIKRRERYRMIQILQDVASNPDKYEE